MEGVLYLAEMYYRNLLNVILDFELKSSKNLNKGIVLLFSISIYGK